jgi:hypothetical protein
MRAPPILLLLAATWMLVQPVFADSRGSSAQPLASSGAVEIDVFCDRLARITKTNRQHLFATLSQDGKPTPWREYLSDHALRTRLKTLGTYSVAEYWRRKDGAVFVETTRSSDTGDWSHFTRLCYRPDGSLVRTEFTMTSFVDDGGIRGNRIQHFAATGERIDVTSEVRNLETNEKRSVGDFDAVEEIYKTVSDLPFLALMK